MKIPAQGLPKNELLETLAGYRSGDIRWREGKSFTHTFLPSEESQLVAEQAYRMYMWENALDPTLFPSAMRLETEIVAMAAAHLSGDSDVCGNFTSGGTESVLLAVKTARDYARAKNPSLERPQMVLPITAHPCFHKAAQYFGVEAIVTPVDGTTFKADVAAMRDAITDRTVLLVGSSPGYAHGVVDPIREIGELARDKDLLLHVDGCIGGFILPWLKRVGADVADFDFSVPGVTSMSMDLHKYALTPKGASVVLYKNDAIRQHQIFSYSGWTGYTLINPTIQSSKSAGPMAAAWSVLHHIGADGYTEIARKFKEASDKIVAGIGEIDGLRILGNPDMCLIAIACDDLSVFRICGEMSKRGWSMYPQPRCQQLGADDLPANFHLTLFPHNVDSVDLWLAELRSCVAEMRSAEPRQGLQELRQLLAAIDLNKLNDGQIGELLRLAGLGQGEMPGDQRVDVDELLNEMPPHLVDRVLGIYYNKLSRYRPMA